MRKLLAGLFCTALVLCVLAAHGAPGQPGETPSGVPTLVSPQTILLGADQGGEVTVHAEIPFSLVDTSTLELNGLPALYAFPDSRGELVVKFAEAEVKAIVAPPSALLTLDGLTVVGELFMGADIVTVKEWKKDLE